MEPTKNIPESTAVYAVFRREKNVRRSEKQLIAAGISPINISILFPPHAGHKNFPQATKTALFDGVLYGGILGSIISFALAVFVFVGAIPLPGVDLPRDFLYSFLLFVFFIISGALLGSGVGALIGIGTPKKASERYADYVEEGGTLVSVTTHSSDEAHIVESILEKNDGFDIVRDHKRENWNNVNEKIFKK